MVIELCNKIASIDATKTDYVMKILFRFAAYGVRVEMHDDILQQHVGDVDTDQLRKRRESIFAVTIDVIVMIESLYVCFII